MIGRRVGDKVSHTMTFIYCTVFYEGYRLGFFTRINFFILLGITFVILLRQQEKNQGIVSLHSARKQVKYATTGVCKTAFLLGSDLLPPMLPDPNWGH